MARSASSHRMSSVFPSQEAGQTTSSVGEEGRSGGLPTIGQARDFSGAGIMRKSGKS